MRTGLPSIECLLDLWQQVRHVTIRVLYEVRLGVGQPFVVEGLLGCGSRVRVNSQAGLDEVFGSVGDIDPVLLCNIKRCID